MNKSTDSAVVHPTGTRNSSIELLKLLACVVIAFSHSFPRGTPTESMPFLIDPSRATGDLQVFLLLVGKYLAQVGNVVFIVASACFLLRSRGIKYRKVFDMIRDSLLISVLFLAVLLLTGLRIPVTTAVKQLIPITMGNNWFVGCYILFYLIHPALNLVVGSMDRQRHLTVCLAVILLYFGINFLLPGRYYYTQLIGFVNIYLLVAYMERYLPDLVGSRKRNLRAALISLTALLLLIGLTNFMGLYIGALSNMADWFSNISNPLIVVLGISAFNVARSIRFESRTVNYLSRLTLLFYIIHANDLVMDYVKPAFFAWALQGSSGGNLLLWCAVFCLILLFGGMILSIAYHEVLMRLLKRSFERLYGAVTALWERSVSAIMDWS